ncbi:CAP domain-containing protein [Candidatus Hydrogenisulfobacillus filiaventi]|uniref:CAP domain-containing protein n=1 Tax=Candidatus Hydrogenisulfobacillus filiaventi TaxID=2707344 RepID=A0A6F8ZDU6_9FIRM|nr:CAP domain-containing protein [Bacillota bacterium]CAB1127813.1 CAP domain-containing protein [Candidatus Hydrogenisulfobacillus filiaventi]
MLFLVPADFPQAGWVASVWRAPGVSPAPVSTPVVVAARPWVLSPAPAAPPASAAPTSAPAAAPAPSAYGPWHPSAAPAGPAPGSSAWEAAQARLLVALTDQDRLRHGLPALTADPELMRLAQERATAMAQDGYFSHDSPVYGWPLQMEWQAGLRAREMGAENIAEEGNVAEANAAFMASPPHRANILDPGETRIGVGVALLPGGNGVAVSELFLGPPE